MKRLSTDDCGNHSADAGQPATLIAENAEYLNRNSEDTSYRQEDLPLPEVASPVIDDREGRLRIEANKWSAYFADALDGRGQGADASYWWLVSVLDSIQIAREYIDVTRPVAICEPGCGSGRTSILLASEVPLSNLSLLDISPSAIEMARSLVPSNMRSKVTLIEGDAFSMPFERGQFHLTWNVGVVEHYLPPQIVAMVGEMLRVTRTGGVVIVGLPNRRSLATTKAALLGTHLGRRWLSWIPGYRFDTEILYGTSDIVALLSRAFNVRIDTRYAGNILWVGAPEFMVRLCQRLWPSSVLSFLSFLIIHND